MQSSMITIRALSRLMKNKFSTFLEPSALQRANPHFISVVCGFPKDLRAKYKVGKFGDDAWFTSTNKVADVIGKNRGSRDKQPSPQQRESETEDVNRLFSSFRLVHKYRSDYAKKELLRDSRLERL